MKLTSVQRRILTEKLNHLHESDFERRKRQRAARLHPSQITDSQAQQTQIRNSSPMDFLKEILKVNHLVAQGLEGNAQEIYLPILPAGQGLAVNLQSRVANIANSPKEYSSDLHGNYLHAHRAWLKWKKFVQQFVKNNDLSRPMYNLAKYPHAVSLNALKQGQEPCSPIDLLTNQCPF